MAREMPDAVLATFLLKRSLWEHEAIEVGRAHVGDVWLPLIEAQGNRLAREVLTKDRHLAHLEGLRPMGGVAARHRCRLPAHLAPAPDACAATGEKDQGQHRKQTGKREGAPDAAAYHPTCFSPARTCW